MSTVSNNAVKPVVYSSHLAMTAANGHIRSMKPKQNVNCYEVSKYSYNLLSKSNIFPKTGNYITGVYCSVDCNEENTEVKELDGVKINLDYSKNDNGVSTHTSIFVTSDKLNNEIMTEISKDVVKRENKVFTVGVFTFMDYDCTLKKELPIYENPFM